EVLLAQAEAVGAPVVRVVEGRGPGAFAYQVDDVELGRVRFRVATPGAAPTSSSCPWVGPTRPSTARWPPPRCSPWPPGGGTPRVGSRWPGIGRRSAGWRRAGGACAGPDG